jgi:tape measure domain-containing protein
MTTERIDIQVREDGSRVVKRRLEDLDPAARKAAGGVDFLKKALASIGGALAVREVLELINTYQNLQNRLRSTGLEAAGLTAVYKSLLDVSNDTRSSVEGSVELYARLATSSKELGVSQQQLIDFTKSLNQAIILSGASATEAQAGLIQLSQGLASGTLRGDELRSVLEQLPAVADVIAKKLGVTRGELRLMGEQGKITAQTVLGAFQDARAELEERFGKTIPTLSQSFQVLKNNVLSYVGAMDEATGFSKTLSQIMMFLANNLDTAAKAALGLASGLLLVGGTAAVLRGATAAVGALTAAIAANPIGALLVVLTSVVTTLVLFSDKINLGVNSMTTFWDLLRAIGEAAQQGFRALYDAALAALGPLGEAFMKWWNTVDISLVGILRGAAKVVDVYVGLWRGAVRATTALFEGVPPALSDLFTQALNAVLEKIGSFVNKAGELLSTVTEFAGLGKIATNIDFTLPNAQAGAAAKLGKDVGAAFMEGFNEQGPTEQFLDKMIDRAKEFSAARAEVDRLAKLHPNTPSTVAGTPAKPPVNQQELDKAKTALQSLLNTIKPSAAAVLELAKAEQTLNNAVKFGLIDRNTANQYLELARKYYQDLIDPLGKINRELDQQIEIMKVDTGERQVAAQLQQITLQLQEQGITLTEKETAGLRAKLTAIEDLNRVVQAQDALYEQSIGKRKEFEAQLVALQNMLANPQFTTGDAATATSNMLTSMGLDINGTQVAIQAQLAAFETMYAQIDAMRQKNLLSEQDAEMLRTRVAIEQHQARFANEQQFFSSLATLSNSSNKKLAAIGKAAAIAQATIDGIVAVQKALASAPPPYNYALAAAVGVAAAANVAKIAGYEQGGYTGDYGKKTVAGVVHGREFVVNAEGTRKNRAALEAMNSGKDLSSLGGNVRVIVNNNADGTRATTQERQTPDGREIEITVAATVARDINRGGPIATAMESRYGLNRAVGSAR